VTLAADPRGDARLSQGGHGSAAARGHSGHSAGGAYENRPVEFWPTAAIRSAVENGDLTVWQRIVAALKRDPYGRTARQVEEVIATASSHGIANALAEVLARARAHLEADERAEVARQVRALLERSGLGPDEFASRVGVSSDDLAAFLEAEVSPSAAHMVRMRRLSERFAKMRAQRSRPGN
jgi:DNA-binding transcriptional regulator YiaG